MIPSKPQQQKASSTTENTSIQKSSVDTVETNPKPRFKGKKEGALTILKKPITSRTAVHDTNKTNES